MFCKDLAHVLQGAESMFLQALSMMLHENGAKMRENTVHGARAKLKNFGFATVIYRFRSK